MFTLWRPFCCIQRFAATENQGFVYLGIHISTLLPQNTEALRRLTQGFRCALTVKRLMNRSELLLH